MFVFGTLVTVISTVKEPTIWCLRVPSLVRRLTSFNLKAEMGSWTEYHLRVIYNQNFTSLSLANDS